MCTRQIVFLFLDLGQFSKSVRDAVTVNNFGGTGIECSPTKHGYPSKTLSQ